MANFRIMNVSLPRAAISQFLSLSRAPEMEPLIARELGESFSRWLKQVAQTAAVKWPKRSGRSAAAIASSARVFYASDLASIRGHMLVPPEVASNEYGSIIVPKHARMLAIPIADGLRPDGSPKRLGPRSWAPYNPFVYKSKRTGKLYIAYRTQRRGLVIIYVLVDKVELKAKRIISTTYDMMLPQLEAEWTMILTQVIDTVYSRAFDEVYAALTDMKMPRLPPKLPDARLHASRLLPRRT